MFYVSQSHHLNSSFKFSNSLSWLNDSIATDYTTTASTRSLSVTSNSHWSNITKLPANITAELMLLFYENQNGTVSALLETGKQCVSIPGGTSECFSYDPYVIGSDLIRRWIDISDSQLGSTSPFPTGTSLYDSYPNATFSAPFSSAEGSEANFTVRTLFNIGSKIPLDGLEGSLFLYTMYESGNFQSSEHRCALKLWRHEYGVTSTRPILI